MALRRQRRAAHPQGGAPDREGAGAGPASAPLDDRHEAPLGARHLVVVIFDSLRHDSALEAGMPTMRRLGELERRHSYASWTAPSHHNLLMGLLPHSSPTHVYASEHYKSDYARYAERLAIPGIEFSSLLPSIWLPRFLQSLGYETRAFVSMPVLNPATPLNVGFDTYELMPSHNDMAAMVDGLRFGERPTFTLLNVGETHYPYATPDEDPSDWPRISGVHGVLKRLDEGRDEPAFFDAGELAELRARQVRAARHVDDVLGHLLDVVPTDTWLVVTSDHGELFGEDGYFGHGPIAHTAVHEVPFVEGLRP